MSDDIVEVCARAMRARYFGDQMHRQDGHIFDSNWADLVADALAALEAAGYAVVPVEPSEAMVEDGRAALSQGDAKVQTHARVLWVWAAMLKASKQDAGEAADRQVSL